MVNVLLATAVMAFLASTSLVTAAPPTVLLATPLARGFSTADASKPPCGGFTQQVNPVAISKNGTITIASWVQSGSLSLNIDFPTGIVATGYLPLATEVVPTFIAPPPVPFNVEVAYDVARAGSGAMWDPNTRAVVQLVFEGAEGKTYQCADVIIDPTTPPPARTDSNFAPVASLLSTPATSSSPAATGVTTTTAPSTQSASTTAALLPGSSASSASAKSSATATVSSGPAATSSAAATSATGATTSVPASATRSGAVPTAAAGAGAVAAAAIVGALALAL
ncbi:hypothetical protein HDU96_002024 [Phlyctochytrium bullatum]|nr:hypothetical protein HDU96_002024 [Phlyctochytrium bullatum]